MSLAFLLPLAARRCCPSKLQQPFAAASTQQQQQLRAMAATAAGAPAGIAPSIVDAIKADHERIMAHCRAVQDPTASYDDRERARHRLVHDLSVHSLAEEEVLYPALKRAFGKELRDHVLDEHTDLKRVLLEVDKYNAGRAELGLRVADLARLLGHHIREEEEEVLPSLAARAGAGELAELGDKFERAKGRVPTRPHAWAPDKPATGNVVADRLTAPLDKARDALSGRDV